MSKVKAKTNNEVMNDIFATFVHELSRRLTDYYSSFSVGEQDKECNCALIAYQSDSLINVA